MSYLKMALQAIKTNVDAAKTETQDFSLVDQRTKNLDPIESTSATSLEGILTCADCPHFKANNGPNPREGWGYCRKRQNGRYGCAMACEATLSSI
jgi:hypothetical protein